MIVPQASSLGLPLLVELAMVDVVTMTGLEVYTSLLRCDIQAIHGPILRNPKELPKNCLGENFYLQQQPQ